MQIKKLKDLVNENITVKMLNEIAVELDSIIDYMSYISVLDYTDKTERAKVEKFFENLRKNAVQISFINDETSLWETANDTIVFINYILQDEDIIIFDDDYKEVIAERYNSMK